MIGRCEGCELASERDRPSGALRRSLRASLAAWSRPRPSPNAPTTPASSRTSAGLPAASPSTPTATSGSPTTATRPTDRTIRARRPLQVQPLSLADAAGHPQYLPPGCTDPALVQVAVDQSNRRRLRRQYERPHTSTSSTQDGLMSLQLRLGRRSTARSTASTTVGDPRRDRQLQHLLQGPGLSLAHLARERRRGLRRRPAPGRFPRHRQLHHTTTN